MFQFENLVVWQRAIEYADLIYTISEVFPTRENFGLARQIQRAAVSVSWRDSYRGCATLFSRWPS